MTQVSKVSAHDDLTLLPSDLQQLLGEQPFQLIVARKQRVSSWSQYPLQGHLHPDLIFPCYDPFLIIFCSAKHIFKAGLWTYQLLWLENRPPVSGKSAEHQKLILFSFRLFIVTVHPFYPLIVFWRGRGDLVLVCETKNLTT